LNCELAQTTIHGYVDGELDAVRSAEFERHLESCAECQAVLEGIESLRTQLRQSNLYEHASPQLRGRIRTQLAQEAGEGRAAPGHSWRRWFLIPAFGSLVAAAAVITIMFFAAPSQRQSALTAELIDAHVRSLQPGHMTDVISTDQHTVKPWFDGKLDFVPPVSDFAAQGFPLVGGRLDVIGGHDVAALVYSRRKHFINLFVWPYRENESSSGSSGSQQGYNWLTWQARGMRFCLVSDAAPSDLRQLQELIQP
jgi:anti-sigma factor RsiW